MLGRVLLQATLGLSLDLLSDLPSLPRVQLAGRTLVGGLLDMAVLGCVGGALLSTLVILHALILDDLGGPDLVLRRVEGEAWISRREEP